VQIGHNCDIGEDVILVSQVAIAGSVTIGNRAMFGGQSGVSDHLQIGEGAMVGGATPVISDVPAGTQVWGFPAKLMSKAKREMVSLARLPELLKRSRQQAALLEQLQKKVAVLEAGQQPVDHSDG
jgi:UDP-3-O-[3-hydroxymyristoyl] glucosamine N-acyltransferase